MKIPTLISDFIYVFFGGIFITAVGNIDTSGISMLEEVKKTLDRRELKVHKFLFYIFVYLKTIDMGLH